MQNHLGFFFHYRIIRQNRTYKIGSQTRFQHLILSSQVSVSSNAVLMAIQGWKMDSFKSTGAAARKLIQKTSIFSCWSNKMINVKWLCCTWCGYKWGTLTIFNADCSLKQQQCNHFKSMANLPNSKILKMSLWEFVQNKIGCPRQDPLSQQLFAKANQLEHFKIRWLSAYPI